jgi:peptide/nickel transport system substrate-binding protein
MGNDRSLWHDGIGCFPRSSPLASDEGIGVLSGQRSTDAARAALAAAGYGGQKVTVLHPTDVVNNNALTTVLTDLLKRSGLDAESATSDWGTVLQRRARRDAPGQGGWNALVVLFGGIDLQTPGQHPLLRANGTRAWFGWPTSPALEALRDEWFAAGPPEAQRAVGRRIQAQFWQDLPFIPLGQYFIDSAWRRDITGVQKGMTLPINVRRG